MRQGRLHVATMAAMAFTGVLWGAASAQVSPGAPPPPATSTERLSPADLEKLVGPIALYPDDLLAILLPAATSPLDIVKAQRFLEKRRADSSLQPDPSLPEPVRLLLNYPEVVKRMSDDLGWTDSLGKAVVSQQKEVIDAIQVFRRKTYSAGNLKTDDKQVVVVEKEIIKVVPANPQVIYVPQYQPTTVVVAQPSPPVVYAPTPDPVYYAPPPVGAAAAGFVAGAATAYAIGWANQSVYHDVDVHELQEERMNYASQSREDWQAHQKDTQSQRQQSASQAQTQRQEGVSGNQAQRQEAVGGAQTQRGETQAQRQQAASGAQAQATSGARQTSGQSWQPSQQSAQAQARTQPGRADASSPGGQGGAFQGVGSSGTSQMQQSQRGSQSRSSMGAQGSAASRPAGSTSSGGGSRGGGRGRR